MVAPIWSLRIKETKDEKSQTRTAAVKLLSPPEQTEEHRQVFYKCGGIESQLNELVFSATGLLRLVWNISGCFPQAEETSTMSCQINPKFRKIKAADRKRDQISNRGALRFDGKQHLCYNSVAKFGLPFQTQPPLMISQKMLVEGNLKCLRLI